MSIREELMALAKSGGGTVHPEAALGWAEENPESALYAAIEARGLWDDTEAAQYGRFMAMKRIIQRVRVKIVGRNDQPITTRAFVSIIEDRNPSGGYRDIQSVLRSPKMSQSLLATALEEFEGMRRRYEHLHELAEVFAAVDKVRRQATRRRGAKGNAEKVGV